MSVTNNLKSWWNVIWHHYIHGTLPAAPQPGGNPVIVAPIAPKQTPPAPELPNIAPQHVDQANSNLDLAHGIPSATLPTSETVPTIAPNVAPAPAPSPVVSSALPNSTPAASTAAPDGGAPHPGHVFAKNGDVVYPGVTLIDEDEGLVQFDPALLPNCAGHVFCCYPLEPALDPTSKAHASVIWNSSSARMADEHPPFLYLRVNKMVAQDEHNALALYAPATGEDQWLPIGAWSIGAEYDTWPAVIEHLRTWQHNGSAGFVPR
jgi:hypothetical protein